MFHHKRKLIAWLLVVVMILTLVPVSRTSSLGASTVEMPAGESPDVTIGEAADAAEVTELEATEKSALTEEETEAVTEEETATEEIGSSEEVTEETDKSEDPDTEEASTEEISTVETSEEEVVTEATEEAVTEEASTEEPSIVINPIEENEFYGASGTASITCIGGVGDRRYYDQNGNFPYPFYCINPNRLGPNSGAVEYGIYSFGNAASSDTYQAYYATLGGTEIDIRNVMYCIYNDIDRYGLNGSHYSDAHFAIARFATLREQQYSGTNIQEGEQYTDTTYDDLLINMNNVGKNAIAAKVAAGYSVSISVYYAKHPENQNIQNMLTFEVTETAAADIFLSIEKASVNTGNKPSMAGIRYDVRDNLGNVFFTFTLDANGKVESVTKGNSWSNTTYVLAEGGSKYINGRLYAHILHKNSTEGLPAGTLTLTESASNANYKKSNGVVSIPAIAAGEAGRKTIASRICNINGAITSDDFDGILSDKPYSAAGVYKVDENNNAVSGATFDLYGTNTVNATTGGTKITALSGRTTGNNGLITYDLTDYYDPNQRFGGYKSFYVVETSAPSGYVIGKKETALTVRNKKAADITTGDAVKIINPHSVFATVVKTSSNPDCTNGNPNYSLAGAEYKMYKDRNAAQAAVNNPNQAGAVATFSIRADGTSPAVDVSNSMNKNSTTGNLERTRMYVVETKAGKNYKRSTSVSEVWVEPTNTSNNPARANVTDEPVNDPFALEIIKTDTITGSNVVPEGKTLEGAKFKVTFYAVDTATMHTAADLKANFSDKVQAQYGKEITVTKRNDGRYIADLDNRYPLGFITIEEIESPRDYSLDGAKATIKNGNDTVEITDNMVFVTGGTFSNNNADWTETTYYPYNASTYDELATKGINLNVSSGVTFNIEVANTGIRGNINLVKAREADDEPIEGVKFEVKNDTTGEVHYIYTDKEGKATTAVDAYTANVNHYDTAADYDGTANEVWFGMNDDGTTSAPAVDKQGKALGALPAGKYTITEKKQGSSLLPRFTSWPAHRRRREGFPLRMFLTACIIMMLFVGRIKDRS